ncbi:hypothetical protein [Enterovirga sp.]|jgi:hypothetical protein|uniref:hypothetical protein n=1 Tax=Enterovirga sp. TaxID=2026350 RepID=UPI00260EAA8D|nr:hypothetical protein [Enterovirga sp.]MDB5591769.1 hypothetical protein [Enterovirga sp.]
MPIRRHLVLGLSALILCGSPALSAPRGGPLSCRAEIGEGRFRALLAECRQVSLQSSRPCDPRRTCGELRAEIGRSCALLGDAAPPFCPGYGAADEDEDDAEDEDAG